MAEQKCINKYFLITFYKDFAGQNKSAHTNTGKNLKSIADDTENLRNETV